MPVLASSPVRNAIDGQRARVVTDAVISAYIHEVARAGGVARRGVERAAENRDDTAGVMARSARCNGARRTFAGRPEVRGDGGRVSDGPLRRRNFGSRSRDGSATARQSA
jgi:hypothetical protein